MWNKTAARQRSCRMPKRYLTKASSKAQGWMKSTKAMEIDGVGCFAQTTSERKNPDGSWSLTDSQAFAAGVKIADDENGGRKLVKI